MHCCCIKNHWFWLKCNLFFFIIFYFLIHEDSFCEGIDCDLVMISVNSTGIFGSVSLRRIFQFLVYSFCLFREIF